MLIGRAKTVRERSRVAEYGGLISKWCPRLVLRAVMLHRGVGDYISARLALSNLCISSSVPVCFFRSPAAQVASNMLSLLIERIVLPLGKTTNAITSA